MVKDVFQAAGIGGNKSNHSLRAAGATQMFSKGVPEKLVQQRTGRRSLDALWMYERPSEEQLRAVSAVLSGSGTAFTHVDKENLASSEKQPEAAEDHITKTAGKPPSGTALTSFDQLQNCTFNFFLDSNRQ
eukprot:m.143422 g.143422  ORF g.143422 m.143422 type:complete len:131 (+) comp38387_c2_seq9:294-686(+)